MADRLARLRSHGQVRRMAIPMYRGAARATFFLPPPRVFANSMPKAGTHLLMAVLDRLPKIMFSGIHHALTDFADASDGLPPDAADIRWDELVRVLARVRNGQYMTGHFPHVPELAELLSVSGFRAVLILRDPRDTLVSQSYYLATLRRHPQYPRYSRMTPAQRLLSSIQGLPEEGGCPAVPSVGERGRRYAAWLGTPGLLVTRFEALVGDGGGGDHGDQLDALRAIADHVGRPVDGLRLGDIARRIRTPRAATFRKGIVGDWRDEFGDEHREAFRTVAGDLLVQLGYEDSDEW